MIAHKQSVSRVYVGLPGRQLPTMGLSENGWYTVNGHVNKENDRSTTIFLHNNVLLVTGRPLSYKLVHSPTYPLHADI